MIQRIYVEKQLSLQQVTLLLLQDGALYQPNGLSQLEPATQRRMKIIVY